MEIDAETKERFFEKVLKLPSGCWIWTGALQGKYYKEENGGYGSFRFNKKVRPAHIVSCHIHGKDIEQGKHIDHLCRVTSCVNPDHLEPVSPKENWLRGENNKGEFHKAKTHCPNGHKYTEENTVYMSKKKGGKKYRACHQCRLKTYRDYDKRRRGKNVSA